jgi:hypothetical protein
MVVDMVSYEQEGFMEFSRTGGKIKARVEGEEQEAEYKAKNFINGAGTIGYAEIEANEIAGFIFLSRTSQGDVVTIPGPEPGPVPFKIGGFVSIRTAKEGGEVEEFYESHMEALKGMSPIADPGWLREEVPRLPQRAVNVVVKIFEMMVEGMEGAMDQIAETLGGGEGGEEGGGEKRCPACGRDVPAGSSTCPACGYDL